MAYGYIEALLDLANQPGTAYGVVFASNDDRCPVKDLSKGACAGCPTEDREEIGFPEVLDVGKMINSFELTQDHIGTTVVADESLSVTSWPKTKELAAWHGARNRPFGAITSGDRIGDLMGELVTCTGLTKIGVSLDAPREQQGSLRGEQVFDKTIAGLKLANQAGLMPRIEIVQVLRKGHLDWLNKLLPTLAEAGVQKISVSAYVDFSKGDDKPLQERILHLRDAYQGLLRYTSRARQLGIDVVVDDLMRVLPLDQGLTVRRKSDDTKIFRLSSSGSIEGFWTTFGKRDPAVSIAHADQIHQALTKAHQRSEWLSPL